MNAEILCIGTELLLGNIVNTNAAWLSQQLARLGINVYHHTVVGDNAQRLEEALHIALGRAGFGNGEQGIWGHGLPAFPRRLHAGEELCPAADGQLGEVVVPLLGVGEYLRQRPGGEYAA